MSTKHEHNVACVVPDSVGLVSGELGFVSVQSTFVGRTGAGDEHVAVPELPARHGG